ncbi:MAG: DUF3090 family protein [Actinomycetota bacterium]|nr:DUF3090 family protein [Actinomycetota bacterium]
MTRRVHDFASPGRFVAGTVGMPGERTFFLQARQGNELTSVALEKAQVSALADRVDQLLDEVASTRAEEGEIPAEVPPGLADAEPLEAPIVEEFRVGAMAIGWDDASRRVVLEAHAVTEDDEDVPDIADDTTEGPDTLRVWLEPARARAFAQRARIVVSAGRPPCPFCSQPLDPSGHVCPRANGYRRRA